MSSKDFSTSIPSTSTQPSEYGSKKNYHRTCSLRLPTPPPDPSLPPSENSSGTVHRTQDIDTMRLEKEHDFLEYLSSLASSSSASKADLVQGNSSVFAPAFAVEDALDHLNKLYKLMEQMLNLREQNSRLQRRVIDLEHMKNLEKMHAMVTNAVLSGESPTLPDLEAETAHAENLMYSLLFDSRSKRGINKCKQNAPHKFKASLLRHQR